MSEQMEEICKNCAKHWFECPKLIFDDIGCGYTRVSMTPDNDTCEQFDPIDNGGNK